MTDTLKNDEAVWQEVTSGVQKLKKDTHIQSLKAFKKRNSKEKTLTVPFDKNFCHTPTLNTKADIDKQTLKRFKKEEFGVEGVLDLHGFTIDAAFSAVQHFIISSYNQNKRAVLIVTGKGLPHKEQDIFAPKGSLKQSVPLWLQSDELKNMILTFIHPSAKLGGNGALYILLRRNRK